MKQEEIEKLCKREPSCYCPERHIILSKVAETPEYLRRYFEEIGKGEVIEDIKKLENPYSKDIFVWDSKKKLDINRGRFNQHCFEIVENTKRDIIKIIKETRGED